MSEKDDDSRLRQLALEEKHSRELAHMSTISAEASKAHDFSSSAGKMEENGGKDAGMDERESASSKVTDEPSIILWSGGGRGST